MTSTRALLAYLATVTLAVAGLAAALGLPIRHQVTDSIIQLETAVVPALILGITWLHHNRTKITAAWYGAHAAATVAQVQPPAEPHG